MRIASIYWYAKPNPEQLVRLERAYTAACGALDAGVLKWIGITLAEQKKR